MKFSRSMAARTGGQSWTTPEVYPSGPIRMEAPCPSNTVTSLRPLDKTDEEISAVEEALEYAALVEQVLV